MTTFFRLLRLLRPHWRGIALSVALGTLTIGSGIALMSTSAYLISAAALLPSVAELQVAIVGVRFFGLSRGVFRYLERLVSHTVTLGLLADLRVWFYQAIEPLAPARLQSTHSGDLLSRAVSDIDTLKDFFVRVVAPPLVAIFIALGFGAFLAFFSWWLTFAFWAALLFVGLVVPVLAHALSRKPQAAWVAARAALSQTVVDSVQGLPDLLANNAATRSLELVNGFAGTTATSEGRLAWVGGLHSALSTFGANMGLWLALLIAIPLVTAGRLPGVALAVIALGTLAAFEAVQSFSQAGVLLQAQLSSARRLFEMTEATPAPTAPTFHPSSPLSPSLSIRNLNFAYEPDVPVLRGLSLDLPPGHKVAILGASGAGKSSLLNLLLRFWDFDGGEITLGGIDIRSLDAESARGYFSVVPQQVHIFNSTIEENLRLAKPDASLAELEEAASRANLLGFIRSQPDGWATFASEHGLRFSGGERQRLGVARALLRPAPILLLDEFTTHLDAATAAAVLAETLAAARGRSILLITHSTDGLDAFDAVYQMIDGQLAIASVSS